MKTIKTIKKVNLYVIYLMVIGYMILVLSTLVGCSSDDDSPIQEEQTIAIPDSNFEQALIDANIDTNGLNGNILKTDAEMVETLFIQDKEISNLQGIEGFINLKGLYAMGNLLTTLNISNNTALLELDFSLNQIANIDISNNVDLEFLEASDNQLSSLDISSNTALKELFCDYNQITDLITGTNTALEYISCEANQIVNLDLSNNTILKVLESNNNQLESLNIKNGNNTNVTFFNVRNNPNLYCITVDDQGYSATNWFDYDAQTSFSEDCSVVNIPDTNFEQALIDEGYDTNGLNGSITKVDAEAVINLNLNNKNISNLSGIEAFINLEILNVNQNHLTSIDLSSNIALTQLHCFLNELSSLDLTNNISLQRLDVKFNNLTSIDFGNNTELYEVSCNNNNLSALDFSANTALYRLDAQNNHLISLNVQNGNNSNFTDFFVKQNEDLYCIKVDNAEYSTQNWNNVYPQVRFSEEDCEN